MAIALRSGSFLTCAQGVVLSLSAKLQYAVITQGSGVTIKGCSFKLSGNSAILVQDDGFTWSGGGADGATTIQISGSYSRLEGLHVANSPGPGIYLLHAKNTVVADSYFEANKGLGIYVTHGSSEFRLERNRAKHNGQELIGIDYSSGFGSVLGNVVEGTGDNCISITGNNNIVSNNVVKGCALSGIAIFGSNNVVENNYSSVNGQAHNPLSTYYDAQNDRSDAGIVIAAEFGGLAQANKVSSNVVIDDQVNKTQAYGLAVYGRIYRNWEPSKLVKAGACMSSKQNLFCYSSFGVSGVKQPEAIDTKDGSATLSFVCAMSTGADEPAANVFEGNVVHGFRKNEIYDGTRMHANRLPY